MDYIKEHSKLNVNKKKLYGEVFTPPKLINEMLDLLPDEVWVNPELKWLDPCAGIANFPFIIYERLMIGLKDIIIDYRERKKHILTKMIYMVELNKENCNHIKMVFKDCDINLYEGSFIDFKHFKKVNIELKFDVILGNPPFQYKEEDKQAQPIWHLFIKRSYEELLNDKGYLLFVHPSGWREGAGIIYNEILKYIKENNLIYLSMNGFKDGQRVFGVGTNYDYYLVQNIKTNDNITIISDIDNINNNKNKEYKLDLNNWDFIPSGNFNQFKLLLSKNKTNLIDLLRDSSSYHTQKKWIINKKTIYPCIYSITQKDGCKFKYSKEKKGHFGIPKVIWSNGAGTYPIIDENGKYGLTEFAYAIIDDKQNLEKIKEAMINKKFINLMKYLAFKEDNKYNYKIIALFKKDFYKYFFY
jgi:hypothetical protein